MSESVIFTVTNTNASGEGSFAWAIEQANAYDGPCRIEISSSIMYDGVIIPSNCVLTNDEASVIVPKGYHFGAATGSTNFTGGAIYRYSQFYVAYGVGLTFTNTYLSGIAGNKDIGLTSSDTSFTTPTMDDDDARFYLYSNGSVVLRDLEVAPKALLQCEEVEIAIVSGTDGQYAGPPKEAHFTAENVTFGADTHIGVSERSTFTLRGCSFKAGDYRSCVSLGRSNYGIGDQSKIITGCNLAHANVKIVTHVADSTDVIDLSGNYWGDGYDTIEKVISIISGYKEGYVIIDNILLEDPVAPPLVLSKPVLQEMHQNLASTLISWESEEGSTYRLLVDDVEVYSGTDAFHELELADGAHSYTVVASDAHGNYRLRSGSLVVDAGKGTLSTEDSVPVFTVLNTASSGDGSFAWAVEQANAHKAACRIEFAAGLEGETLALSSNLRIYNTEAEIADPSGLAINISQNFAFNTDVHAVGGEQVTFCTTARYAKVSIGSNIIDTPIALSGVVIDLSAGKEDSVTFTAETSLTDCTITGSAWMYVQTDVTASGVSFRNSEVTVEDGGTLTMKDSHVYMSGSNYELRVDSGCALHMEGGSVQVYYRMSSDGEVTLKGTSLSSTSSSQRLNLHSSGKMRLEDLYMARAYVESYSDDTLSLERVTIAAGSEFKVKAGSTFSMKDCTFQGGSSKTKLTLAVDAEMSITGCNLANTTISVSSGSDAEVGMLDLSGNYWGDGIDTLEKIIARISGYNAAFVRIDSWLTAIPVSLAVPKLTRTGKGRVQAVLGWQAEEGASVVLKVDGKVVYSGTETSYSGEFKDGAHEYSVIVTDSAGNIVEKVGSFYCDASAPTLSVSKPKYAKLAEGQMEVTLSWKGELGATYRVKVDGVTIYEGTDSSCQFTHADGVYEYSITATDAAGNETTKKGTLSYDAVSPELSLSDAVPVAYALKKGKGKVDFSWEGGESGLTYTIMVDGKKAYTGKGSSKTLTIKDGTHSYSIIAKDKAGNTTEVAGADFSFDATAPVPTLDVPEISYGTSGDGGSATLRWSANESACSYKLTVQLGKTIVATYEGSDTSFSTETLPAGKYSYSLVATDANGNSSAAKKGSFTIAAAEADTEAPTVSDITHSVKAGKNGQASVTISWKGSEKGSTYTLMVNGDIAYVGTATKRTLTLPAGEHSYSIIATDKAGNRSEAATGELTYSAPMIDQHATTLSWAPQEGSSYVLKVDNKLATPDADGSYNWAGLKDGKHKYTLTATDEAGNITTYSGSFVADTKAPKVTLGKAKTSKAGEGLMNATLNWKGEKGATYTLTVDGEAIELSDPSVTSYTLSGLADGTHRYSVTATDAAGNTSVAAEGSFSHDATAPELILGGISDSAVTSKGVTRTKVSFSWVGEDGVSYTVMVDGKKQKVSKLTATTSNLAAGEHSYSIIAKDKAGNISTTTGSFTTDGEGNASWSADAITTTVPGAAQSLVWGGTDTDGISSADVTDAANGYSFELEEARQLIVKLDGLSEDATVILQQAGGQGSIALATNGAAGLDRELSLSAGTYYLQVVGSDGASALASGYTLDLELEKNGKKQPLQQASLAASL